MFLMFEKGNRGGISVISHKYAMANNAYLPDFNENEESSGLFQRDIKNLSGYAMKQMSPKHSFNWDIY